jgi:hypothetical protein
MCRQAALAAAMRTTASWRQRKAREYAEDHIARHRSNRASTALRTAAKFVDGMDPDDRDLAWLRHVELNRDRLHLCEESNELLSRFGIDPGAWRDGRPTETQIRNLLRRVSGAESRARADARRDAS